MRISEVDIKKDSGVDKTKGLSIYNFHGVDQFSHPQPAPPHLQKWTIDLLFKISRIRKHVTNFKILPLPTFRVDVINKWSLTVKHFNLTV